MESWEKEVGGRKNRLEEIAGEECRLTVVSQSVKFTVD